MNRQPFCRVVSLHLVVFLLSILSIVSIFPVICLAEEDIKLAYLDPDLFRSAAIPDFSVSSVQKDNAKEKKMVLPDRETMLNLAESNHIELFKMAKIYYEENITNYSAIFYKHERLDGVLKPRQVIDIDFMEKPYSLKMVWQENSLKCDKLIYVEGQHDNKMVVHPTGFFSWIKSVKREPDCKDVMKSTRKPCNHFGFYRTLESLLATYETAKKNGDLNMKFLGIKKVDNRECLVLQRNLPVKDAYPSTRLDIYFDIEYFVPISLRSYDKKGELISHYKFENVNFNTDIDKETFCLKANKM